MKAFGEVSSFQSRWRIRGTLTTLGPLHVGDGNELEMKERQGPADRAKKGDDAQHDASTVCTDWRGRACIPGSAIKGALRARARAATRSHPEEWRKWESLLGWGEADSLDAEGGKVEFSDALLPANAQRPPFAKIQSAVRIGRFDIEDGAPPWWSDRRFTGVAVSVCLDRRTRTAKETLLYHLEYVPAGVSFEFELTGDNLSDDDVARLLALLDTFNRDDALNPQPATLGAQASNAWGRMRWERSALARFTAENLADWLKQDAPASGYAMCRTLDPVATAALEAKMPRLGYSREQLTISLTLHFSGPLLVRDPQQRERTKEIPKASQEQRPPDGTPVLDVSGNPVIPAKTLRGVLRARAEMILRTLELKAQPPYESNVVKAPQDLADCDLAEQLFGAPGWRGPLEVGDLTPCDPNEWCFQKQEFVAIDRFDGGSAGSKKFCARAVFPARAEMPVRFRGALTVDLDRLTSVGDSERACGLLALVLRDLAEGDLAIGSKSSIGYGVCTADISWGGKPLLAPDSGAAHSARVFRAHAGRGSRSGSSNPSLQTGHV